MLYLQQAGILYPTNIVLSKQFYSLKCCAIRTHFSLPLERTGGRGSESGSLITAAASETGTGADQTRSL